MQISNITSVNGILIKNQSECACSDATSKYESGFPPHPPRYLALNLSSTAGKKVGIWHLSNGSGCWLLLTAPT
jgi:hypothetical protein